MIAQLDEHCARWRHDEEHRLQQMEQRIGHMEIPSQEQTFRPCPVHDVDASIPGQNVHFEPGAASHRQAQEANPEHNNARAEILYQAAETGRSQAKALQSPAYQPKEGAEVYRRKYRRGQHNNSPFVDEIVNAQFIEDFDRSFLSKYDGSQDPQVHIDEFDMQMCVRGIDEPIISRIFITTLTSAAQTWFHTLLPRSIHNFEDFGQNFLINFATSKKQPKSEFVLGKIRQHPGETLQSYLDRFKEAAL